jgi:hypothetical protein
MNEKSDTVEVAPDGNNRGPQASGDLSHMNFENSIEKPI